MTRSRDRNVEELLASDAWMRRLARRMARDPDVAEDLVQDAWVAALSARAPGDSSASRPFMHGVLRNLWNGLVRKDRRRVAREERVARTEEMPAAAELVAELTLRREVVDALLLLEEPWRSTLYRRFFQDRSLREIAREDGLPISTVHDRVTRGLVRLRNKLDRAYGDDRKAWASVLLPLAGPSGLVTSTIVTLGGIAMGTGGKLAATFLIVGGAVAWMLEGGSARPEEPEFAAPAETLLATSPSLGDELKKPEVARATVQVEPSATEAKISPHPKSEYRDLRGRVIDTAGQPVPGLRVGFQDNSGRTVAGPTDVSGPDGNFVLVEGSAAKTLTDGAATHVGSIDERYVTLGASQYGLLEENEEIVLVVAPASRYSGTVIGGNGAPIEGAVVEFHVYQSLFRSLAIERPYARRVEAWRVTTNADGAFAFPRLAGGEHVGLEARATGYEMARLELPIFDAEHLVITLEPNIEGYEIHGLVLDEQASPVSGAKVSAGLGIVLTDEQGRFALVWNPQSEKYRMFTSTGDGVYESPESHQLIAIKEGKRPATATLDEGDIEDEIVLTLGSSAATIAGRIVDPDGNPLEDVLVWEQNPTNFGHEENRDGGSVSYTSMTVEESLRGGFGERGSWTNADGWFEITGLLQREYRIQAADPETAMMSEAWKVHPDDPEREFVFASEPSVGRVAGRVVDGHGRPLPDVKLRVMRSMSTRYVSYPTKASWKKTVITDDEGRFEFKRLALGDTGLELWHPKLFLRHIELANHDDLEDIVLVEPLLCDMQVDLGEEQDLADGVRVLDDSGKALRLIESLGAFLTMHDKASVAEGRSGVLRVPETGTTLVLLRGEEEVFRRSISLTTEELTIVRP